MGARKATGPDRLRSWRKGHGLSLAEMGEKVGDPDGGQVGKFERRARPLPFHLAAEVARVTGIPLAELLTPSQLELAHQIRDIVNRDLAA